MDKIIENIKRIVDDESFVEISKEVTDNCVIGYGTVCGKLLYIISDTGKFIDDLYLKKVKHIYELAIKTGAPIVYIMDNQGLKLDDNIKALSYYGDIINRRNLWISFLFSHFSADLPCSFTAWTLWETVSKSFQAVSLK